MQDTESIPVTGHFIGGEEVGMGIGPVITVSSPWDGSRLGEVPVGGAADVDRAVQAAEKAFLPWSSTPVKERALILSAIRDELSNHMEEIAGLISRENGKTISEARAEVEKGMEVVEFAASLPQLLQQEILEVSTGVDCSSRRLPLGVVAGITPFNFPAMVPLWMIPIAIGTGNCFILKPSEQVPLTANLLGRIFLKAGLPHGVFNVVHGDRSTAAHLIAHPGIRALGFVGSSAAAKSVYEKGTAAGKRVLALGGAKNHLVVMPDAEPAMTAANVVASAFGCAGQRCMAASVLILVGDSEKIYSGIVAEAGRIRAGEEMGAVISAGARDRIRGYIDRAEQNGAKITCDGRKTEAREEGYFVNPTIIEGVEPGNEAACDEIFGPVLTVLRVDSLDAAIAIEAASPYGNAASIYTTHGGAARYFAEKARSGMIGVNVGVPVPREPFSFGGWNQSRFGYGDITGMDGVRFWTDLKKITTKWSARAATNWMS